MKRLRIWKNSLTLLQQFLSILFFVVIIFGIFFFTLLPRNIDNFVNQQMYTHIHRAQEEYLQGTIYDTYHSVIRDDNVYHYVYSKSANRYLNEIKPDTFIAETLDKIDPNIIGETFDGYFNINNNDTVVYSIRNFDDNYALVSIITRDYRSSFKTALVESTVDTTLLMVVGLFVFLMLWVMSIIRPLNTIRNYIEKLRKGEKPVLNIDRKDEIGELAEALEQMNDELSKQQHIREEMIQNISHDLKTPIATIKSYSESIKDGVYPYDTLEKSVDVIIEHADRLEKKVYSLITFNKMGYLVDDLEPGDNLPMLPIVNSVVNSLNALKGNIVINLDLQDVSFHGEKEPWRIVVENLVDNALRYAKTEIIITLNEEGLTVYNDGELMDNDRIEKLFKPYEKGTKGRFGLGLSIVKRVTETYGYLVVGENKTDGVIFRVIKPKTKKFLKLSNNDSQSRIVN